MTQQSVFYYPYASFADEQSILLKVAALYFDKLYILDPMKATFGRIGIGRVEEDVRLLEQVQILERVAPEEVLNKHESTILAAIQRDLGDAEFRRLCAEKGSSTWTLALAKIPKDLRETAAFQPLDESMKRVFKGVGYAEVYDEYRESAAGVREYRYADCPFEVGEAIMLNHALVGGILHAGAAPITDDEIHSSILNHKLSQAQQQVPEIRAAVADRQAKLKLASAKLAAQALADIDLGVIPADMQLETILDYRRRYAGELQTARDKLQWMAREITHQPWTQEFEDDVFHKVIPELNKALEPARSSWSGWLKPTALALGAAATVLGIFANPLTSVAVAVAGLTITKGGIAGLDLYQDWKQGKTQNGLHYLLRLKGK
jgi:hypothetical protein